MWNVVELRGFGKGFDEVVIGSWGWVTVVGVEGVYES